MVCVMAMQLAVGSHGQEASGSPTPPQPGADAEPVLQNGRTRHSDARHEGSPRRVGAAVVTAHPAGARLSRAVLSGRAQ